MERGAMKERKWSKVKTIWPIFIGYLTISLDEQGNEIEIIIITSDSDIYGTMDQQFNQQQENTLCSFRLLFLVFACWKASKIPDTG